MVDEGFLTIGFQIADDTAPLLASVKRYASAPMSLADECMVRLAELHPASAIWTLNRDFTIYRKNGRQVIALISPPPIVD